MAREEKEKGYAVGASTSVLFRHGGFFFFFKQHMGAIVCYMLLPVLFCISFHCEGDHGKYMIDILYAFPIVSVTKLISLVTCFTGWAKESKWGSKGTTS